MDRRRLEISLGALVIISLAVMAYVSTRMGHLKGLAGAVRVTVVFDNAAGLVEGAAVRIAGVQIGRLETLAVDFNKARTTLLLEEQAQVRTDALVYVRARSPLLGEKYVEVVPKSSTAPLIQAGDVLTAAPSTLELDQVVGELGPLLQTVDLEALGPLLRELNGLVTDNRTQVTDTLGTVQSMVVRLEAMDFDDPQAQQDLKAVIRNLKRTSDKLPKLVDEADRTLVEVSERLPGMVDRVDRILVKLEPSLDLLPQTLSGLNGTLAGLDRTLTRLDPILARVDAINLPLVLRLLREEGLLIRFKSKDIEEESSAGPAKGEGEGQKAEGGGGQAH